MSKIELKICLGTMCYVMGGAELKDVIETLPQEMRECIDIRFSPCLGYCNEKQSPPYVELNGKVVAGVSKHSLMQMLKEEINHVV